MAENDVIVDDFTSIDCEIDNLESAQDNLLQQLIVTKRMKGQQNEFVEALEEKTRQEIEKLQAVEDKEKELLAGLKAIEEPSQEWKWKVGAFLVVFILLCCYCSTKGSFLQRQVYAVKNMHKAVKKEDPCSWKKYTGMLMAGLTGVGVATGTILHYLGYGLCQLLN